ncbi:DUF1499 domain-containing protein [Marinobacter sp. CHS3-4]|uniref:DUF1499 domain-containing protein n=1 Tax=Marinobacter sp. CHS3-4 TaxID=3045174 RepID=UPI0024B48FD2|nr:DUF1499 domain-containing protein [Marinobacter sp. CHS3-4]MDI9244754.1 DUF1499 domain-containing protein [Marinobacter sp. CHS3-4]
MLAGKRPKNLGVKDGKLAACPGKPNCVSSQASSASHRVPPLPLSGEPAADMKRLKEVVNKLPGASLVEEDKHYLYFECASKLLGFVDDLEFYCDPAEEVIHVRSASRLGYSDLGVNRKRIEGIRRKFELA